MLVEVLSSFRNNWLRRYTIYNFIQFVINGFVILWSEISASVHAWESAALEILYAGFYIWYRRWAYSQIKAEFEAHEISFTKRAGFKSIFSFIEQLRARAKTSRVWYWDMLLFLLHLLFGLTLIAFMLQRYW